MRKFLDIYSICLPVCLIVLAIYSIVKQYSPTPLMFAGVCFLLAALNFEYFSQN